MYDNHFGLKETPFTIAPDPRFLYMSERHREALAHLVYGFETDGGFVLLTGEVGTGKTTISRCLLEQLPEKSSVAVVLNPKISGLELLATICDELHIDYPKENTSVKSFIDLINAYLLETNAQGRKTVVIVEEAQNLEFEVLELLRLLTNLETNQRKLLQIIMIGQPELLQLLAKPELRQLEQRITARYHLLPLSQKDAMDYVKHRLDVAGLKEPVFSYPLLKKVYKYTDGIPRKINLLCDRAMLGAYVQNQRTIDKKILARAANEVFGDRKNIETRKPFWNAKKLTGLAVVALLVAGGLGVYFYKDKVSEFIAGFSWKSDSTVEPAVASKTNVSGSASGEAGTPFFNLPGEDSAAASKRAAYVTLFAQWGHNYFVDSSDDPCELATTKRLGCLSKNGSLENLKQLDRPAILEFSATQEKPIYATLISLSDNQATLRVADKNFQISIAELELKWTGDYTVLWRLPPSYNGAIRLGTNGEDVQWLASSLANINGQDSLIDSFVSYDARLIRRVKNFQRDEGLASDGIAGVQTLIRINSAIDKNIPRLSSQPAAASASNKQSATIPGSVTANVLYS